MCLSICYVEIHSIPSRPWVFTDKTAQSVHIYFILYHAIRSCRPRELRLENLLSDGQNLPQGQMLPAGCTLHTCALVHYKTFFNCMRNLSPFTFHNAQLHIQLYSFHTPFCLGTITMPDKKSCKFMHSHCMPLSANDAKDCEYDDSQGKHYQTCVIT